MAQLKEISDANLIAHKLVSIEFIRNAGALAVRVNAREKSPAKGWSPKTNDHNLSEIILREAQRVDYEMNLGIHLSGPLVDVDVDSDAPALMDALERFLPSTPHVWGRSSRLRTHRVYQLKADFEPSALPILRMVKKIPEVKVELRGGQQSNGQYSVVPGSIHPSGEEYLWHDLKRAKSALVLCDQADLLRAIRLAGAVAVLAPYWVEGLRNDLTMALTGFLYRTAKISEALGEDVTFMMDRDMAERFMAVLLEVCGDDGKDYRARYKTFEQTWRKAEDEMPVTGGATITNITGDPAILAKLYSLLCDSPDITTLDEFTARFAVWSGPGLVIDLDGAVRGTGRPFMTRQQFCNSFGHRFINSGGKRKLVADLLFHMPTTQRLAGVTFEPGKALLVDTREGRKVNQWAGFQVEPHPEPVVKEQVAPFLDYLYTVISSSQPEVYQWVLGWIAHIFQEPSFKTGTALVLVGLPGVGKSFIGEHFLVPLIGVHAVTTSSADRAVQGFNALFDNRVYVQCDEAISNRQRQTAARLKSLITDPTIIIEPKGIDPYEKPNHMRLLFTSNETRDAVFLTDGMDDRRYTVLEVSPIQKGRLNDYWRPLAKWALDKANLARVHRYLLDVKYDRAAIATPLKTEAKVLMQEHSMPVFDRWLASWIPRGHPLSERAHKHWYDAPIESVREIRRDEWPLRVNYNALAEDLVMVMKNDLQHGTPLNGQQIRTEMRKRGFAVDALVAHRIRDREFDAREQKFITTRVHLYGVPSEADLKMYLQKKYGGRVEDVETQDFIGSVNKEEF